LFTEGMARDHDPQTDRRTLPQPLATRVDYLN
jgi:hypothetical protein